MIQNTIEWKKMRKSKIGASDAPVIMCKSPWKTPFQLWEEKMGFYEQPTTEAMQRGIQMEQEARIAFEKLTEIPVFQKVMIHAEYDWMIASLDGIDIEHKRIVEIKCPGKLDHECAMDGEIPEKYFPQLQHQMIVCDLDMAFYFSYTHKNCKLLEIYRCREYEESLLQKEREFFKCLVDLEPPSLTIKDYQYMDHQEWTDISKEYLKVKFDIQSLQQKEENLRKRLIEMSGYRNCIGKDIKISKYIRKGNIDYSRIPELKVLNLEDFRKSPVETWRIDKV
jgi:putative phage-type endonuclease